MKTRILILSCLAVAVVLFMSEAAVPGTPNGETGSRAGSEGTGQALRQSSGQGGLKIGTVSVQKIFEVCKKSAKYQEENKAEQDRLNAELEKLDAEIKAEEAGLKTLKSGSNDYMTAMKGVLTKRAGLQAQQEFYKRQLELKYQRWVEELYGDVLRVTNEVAKEKGLDLVIEKDEIEFPASSIQDALTVIRTHKVLYSGGCPDFTDEVVGRLDSEKVNPSSPKATTRQESEK